MVLEFMRRRDSQRRQQRPPNHQQQQQQPPPLQSNPNNSNSSYGNSFNPPPPTPAQRAAQREAERAAEKVKLEEIRSCADLLRRMYAIDLEIWKRGDDEPEEVARLQRKADAVFREVRRMTAAWQAQVRRGAAWSYEEQAALTEICNVIASEPSRRYGTASMSLNNQPPAQFRPQPPSIPLNPLPVTRPQRLQRPNPPPPQVQTQRQSYTAGLPATSSLSAHQRYSTSSATLQQTARDSSTWSPSSHESPQGQYLQRRPTFPDATSPTLSLRPEDLAIQDLAIQEIMRTAQPPPGPPPGRSSLPVSPQQTPAQQWAVPRTVSPVTPTESSSGSVPTRQRSARSTQEALPSESSAFWGSTIPDSASNGYPLGYQVPPGTYGGGQLTHSGTGRASSPGTGGLSSFGVMGRSPFGTGRPSSPDANGASIGTYRYPPG
jgi:hypothetical protein